MKPNPRGTALLYSGGMLADLHGKTSHGLLRYSKRFQILGVVDHKHAGRMSAELVSNCQDDLPIYSDITKAIEGLGTKPEYLIIGLSFHGGLLPETHRNSINQALKAGINVVSGLHQVLGEDPEFAKLAKEFGSTIYDIRRPKKIEDLSFWTGKVLSLTTPRIAVLGTDCALGKRTTCQFLLQACHESNIKAELIYTGQTGFLQGFKHGFLLDATLNDFVTGELEKAIMECDAISRPEIMLIEGQSSLRNPSGPCGSELILAGDVNGVILVHAIDRDYFEGFEELKLPLPTIEEEIKLIASYGKKTIAVCINSDNKDFDTQTVADQLNLPVVNPIFEKVTPIIEVIKETILQ